MIRDWRSEIEAALSAPLSERAWGLLKKRGYVAELDQQPELFEQIVAKIAETRDAFRMRRADRVLTQPARAEISRMEAVSRLYSSAAANEDDVKTFRERVLTGQLIALDQLESWIQAKRSEERGAHLVYEVPVGPDIAVRRGPTGTVTFDPPISGPVPAALHARALEYPKEGAVARVPVVVGGMLDALRIVTESLSRRYGWQAAQATAFVMTGATPLLADVRGGTEQNFSTGYTRIKLDLDPRVSARELLKAYSPLRRRVVGGRHRDLGAKHLRLAVFVGEVPSSTTWRARMSRWNSEMAQSHPRWKYTTVRNFTRDAKAAFRRVLGAEFAK